MTSPHGTVELRGLCWDHPRCTVPMAAAAARWERLRPDVRLRWDARPLAAFNDQPIAEAAEGYDLLFVDHPMMGETARTGCLVPLDDLLPPSELDALAAGSIGGSHGSYTAAGRQWALAVDAACQVSVAATDVTPPKTWPEVLEFARRDRDAVALPLYPSDAFCSLLSISANDRASRGAEPRHESSHESSHEPRYESSHESSHGEPFTERAVETLVELAALVHPRSFDLNPPALLNLMADGFAAYAPLIFGYAAYHRGRLRFGDVPSFHDEPSGAVLGGAGLAVTSASPRTGAAAEFAAWIAGQDAQRHVVCPNGGQPAAAAAWSDPTADAEVGGFFSATKASVERVYVRPREPWWPRFQRRAGVRLAELLREGAPARRVHAELTDVLEGEATT